MMALDYTFRSLNQAGRLGYIDNKLHGRRRDMGLGPLSIANHINVAREKSENARALVKSGVDPIDSRSHTQAKQVVEVEARMNFRDVIEKFFQAKDDAGYFRTQQTRRRWYFCLTTHASRLHAMELKDINTRSVYETVLPLWKDKTETASRTRLYLEALLAWSIALEMREGPNPATWRGNLDQLLTPKERVSPSRNHPSLPWQQVPELMGKLRNLETPASFLTEFIILTASRSGEARGAQWDEMSIDLKTWSITAH